MSPDQKLTDAWVTVTNSLSRNCDVISFPTRARVASVVIVTVSVWPTHWWWVKTFINIWNKINTFVNSKVTVDRIKTFSVISCVLHRYVSMDLMNSKLSFCLFLNSSKASAVNHTSALVTAVNREIWVCYIISVHTWAIVIPNSVVADWVWTTDVWYLNTFIHIFIEGNYVK